MNFLIFKEIGAAPQPKKRNDYELMSLSKSVIDSSLINWNQFGVLEENLPV